MVLRQQQSNASRVQPPMTFIGCYNISRSKARQIHIG